MGEGEGSESGVVHGGFVRVVAKGDLYLPTVPTGSCCVERSRGCARIEFRNSADAPFGTPTLLVGVVIIRDCTRHFHPTKSLFCCYLSP